MAIRKIVTVPNSILKTKAEKIDKITPEIKELAKDLLDTLKVAKEPEGAGLAANQIGVAKHMCVVRNFVEEGRRVFMEEFVLINPKIISKSTQTETEYEGCLSVPDAFGEVARFKEIKIEAQNLFGDTIRFKATGFFARTLQHEIDHLNGILFTDKVEGEILSEKDLDKLYE